MDKIWKNLYLATLFLVATFAAGYAQEFEREKVDEALLQKIQKAPAAYHTVGLLLAEQVDLQAMEAHLRASKATLEERAYLAITSLRQKAAQTQPALLEQIKGAPGIAQASVQPFWITNAIFLDANAEGIRTLSGLPNVARLALYQPPELHGSALAAQPSTPMLDATEQGLIAIGAPQMWAMGYTGYGTRALIVDSGQDGSHPALRNHFLYHRRPINQAWPNSEGPYYCGFHGTHVTGTVLGLDRLTEDTIGVAFDAQWMGAPIPLNNCGEYVGGNPVNEFAALQWAIDPDGDPSTIDDMPHVINNSWGISNPTVSACQAPFLGNTIEALYTAGIAVVWSAGNDGPGAQTIGNPAMVNNSLVRIMSVGNVNGNSPTFPASNSSSRGPSICGGEGSLLIKPEVSAPGSNVRSSVLNGDYARISGTSMAAPHVAGAALLLKEAFPNLTGEEILLALYFSAIDLGAPGEDNTYGMGIINLPAAYQYLINEGHEPAPPTLAPNDVVLLDIEAPALNCEGQAVTRLLVMNNGTEPIASLDIRHAVLSSGTPEFLTHHWEGLIDPGERQTVPMPPLPAQAGDFEYVAEVFMANGQPDARILNNQLKTRVRITADPLLEAQVSGGQGVCQNGQALLQSAFDGEGTVRWYNAPEGGNVLAEGRSALLPVGADSFTVYMETTPLEKVGRPDNQGGVPQTNNISAGLRFDAFVPFTIKSVKVYAEETGARLLALRGPNGYSRTKIASVTEVGEQRIELDLDVPAPGEGWELVLTGGAPLGINVGGSEYPYTIPNLLSINSSTESIVFYHYFYDWEVEYNYFCGRTPVAVPVQAALSPPQAAFSPTDIVAGLADGSNEVDFFDASSGGVSWAWDFGDGNTSALANPTHTYTDTGRYQVFLTVTGEEGCTSSTSGTVTVTGEDVSSVKQQPLPYVVKLFPNPTRGLLYLSVGLPQPQSAEVTLADVLGLPVWRRNVQLSPDEAVELSVNGLPAGLYTLIVRMDEGVAARRVVVRR